MVLSNLAYVYAFNQAYRFIHVYISVKLHTYHITLLRPLHADACAYKCTQRQLILHKHTTNTHTYTLEKLRNILLQYRAEFPIEFP